MFGKFENIFGTKKKDKNQEQVNHKGAEEEKAEEGTKEVSESIENQTPEKRFETDFNIENEDLQNIEGFGELSDGQKLLVLENLKQLTLGRIQEEAGVEYRENTAKANFLGRVWQNVSKNYQVAKLEKNKASEIIKGGMEAHGQVLKQLVDGMNNFDTEVEEKDGRLEIQYVTSACLKDLKFNSEEERREAERAVKEFNNLANEYRRMPYEWSVTASSKKGKFREAEAKFYKSRAELLNLINSKSEKENNQQEAMELMNDADKKIKLNQFLNSHPEVEEQLQKISDKKVWMRSLKNVITERGFYLGAGYATRAATISAIGLIGAPLAAAAVGATFNGMRAKERITERDFLNRRKGTEDKLKSDEEYKNIKKELDEELEKQGIQGVKKVEFLKKEKNIKKILGDEKTKKLEEKNLDVFEDAEKLTNRLSFLCSEISKLTDKGYESGLTDEEIKEKDKLASSLNTRVLYTQYKINNGKVNFGATNEKINNQLNLIQKLEEAKILALYNEEPTLLDQRIDRFLNFKAEKIKKEKNRYIRNEMIKGALLSAGCASAGIAIRHFAGEWLGWNKSGFLDKKHLAETEGAKAPMSDEEFYKNYPGQKYQYDPNAAVKEVERINPQEWPKTPEGYLYLSKTPATPAVETAGIAETAQAAQETAGQNVIVDSHQFEQATVGHHEGIEHAFKRQLINDPENFGYDKSNGLTPEKWAEGEAHRIAIRGGYVDQKTGEWVGVKPENKIAYVLENDKDGNIKVSEYVKSDDGKFETGEARELAADYKNAEFEKDLDNYEYKGRTKIVEHAEDQKRAAVLEEIKTEEKATDEILAEQPAETITPNTIETPEKISFKLNEHSSLKQYDYDRDGFLNEEEIAYANKNINFEINKYKEIENDLANIWASDDAAQNYMAAQHPGEIETLKNLKTQRDLLAEPLAKIKAAEINAAEAPEAKIDNPLETSATADQDIIGEDSGRFNHMPEGSELKTNFANLLEAPSSPSAINDFLNNYDRTIGDAYVCTSRADDYNNFILNFTQRGGSSSYDLYITENGKIYVNDAGGSLNGWHNGDPVDFNEANLKDALKFINKGEIVDKKLN